MKLTVTKKEFLDKLSNIRNIVKERNTMPVLSHFLLDAAKAGSTITATDIETTLREPLNAEVSTEGRFCIPTRKLLEIVREVDGDITVQSENSGWLRVVAGGSSFRLACLPPEEFPSWPQMEETREIALEPAVLSTMIEKTVYATGEEDTRYILNGILFQLNNGKFTMVGTDGHRLAIIFEVLNADVEQETKVIVPKKSASELRKFLGTEGQVSVLIGSNNILFKIGGVEFLARLIEGTYPDYTQVIPSGNEKRLEADRVGLIKALRRVSIMSHERSNAVKLKLDSGSLTLSSSTPSLGEASDSLEVGYSGEAMAVGFNARYLLDILQAMKGDRVVVELQDPLSSALFRDEGDENYRCVAMPMRV